MACLKSYHRGPDRPTSHISRVKLRWIVLLLFSTLTVSVCAFITYFSVFVPSNFRLREVVRSVDNELSASTTVSIDLKAARLTSSPRALVNNTSSEDLAREIQVYNEVNSVEETVNFEMDSASNSSTLVEEAAVIDEKNAMVYNFAGLKHLANQRDPYCNLSIHFKSWEKGVVTEFGIPIKRDCGKLREHSHNEISNVKAQVESWKELKPWEEFALKYKYKNCREIREDFENNFYVSELEHNFPIAYIFVVHTNAGQIIRFLKSIYRPHNLYCIHPDKKQGNTFADCFKEIAKCLDNVFIVSQPLSIYYAHHSLMDAQLNCMEDLAHYPDTRWHYVINLSGREIPLKTNREIVESLQKLKGYTALDLQDLTPYWQKVRFSFQHRLNDKGHMENTQEHQVSPPHGIKLSKSLTFLAASRTFVQFMLNDQLSLDLRNYLKTVCAPEEHYYSSLYILSRAKGAKPPNGMVKQDDIPMIISVIWIISKSETPNCLGKVVHNVCILSTADIAKIYKLGIQTKRSIFFFNKYFLDWDPTPMDCMEERLVSTNIAEYRRDCMMATRNHL